MTENRKVWARKSLIFRYPFFGFGLKKANLQQSPSLRAPVKLLGDQLLVPAQKRIGSREGRHFFQARAPERAGEGSEAAAFGIGEAEPAPTEVGFEDAVFLVQISDDVLLMTLNPAATMAIRTCRIMGSSG